MPYEFSQHNSEVIAADDNEALLSILAGTADAIQSFFDQYWDDPEASAQWVETALVTHDRHKLQQEPWALGFRLALAGDMEARLRLDAVRRRLGWSDADKHGFMRAIDPDRKLRPITLKVPDDLSADDLRSYLSSYSVSPYDLIDHKPLQRQLIAYWQDAKGKAALQDYVRANTSYDNYQAFQVAMDVLITEAEGRFVDGGVALSHLMQAPPMPLRFLCPRLMRESGLTVFAGRPKVGKSTLALQYMLAVAGGAPFLDFFAIERPGRVLYMAFEEDPLEIVHHVRGLGATEDAASNIYLPRVDSQVQVQMGKAFFAQLDTWRLHAGAPARLIVIDVLAHVLPATKARGNAYEQDYTRLRPLIDYAQETGIHIMAITHLSKAYKQTQDVELAIMGSTGISASATSLWILLSDEAEKGYAQLHVSGRGLPKDDFSLVRKTSGHVLSFGLDEKTESASPERLAILSEMYAHRPQLYSVQQLAKVLSHERSSLNRMLGRMALAGLVINVRGQYDLTPRGFRIAEDHAAKADFTGG